MTSVVQMSIIYTTNDLCSYLSVNYATNDHCCCISKKIRGGNHGIPLSIFTWKFFFSPSFAAIAAPGIRATVDAYYMKKISDQLLRKVLAPLLVVLRRERLGLTLDGKV